MKKYIFYLLIFIGSVGLVSAQDRSEPEETSVSGFAPEGGDFSAAIIYGRGLFASGGLVVPVSVTANSSVSGASPNAYNIVGDGNDASNMLGAELRYFISNNFALKLSGAVIMRHTPDRPNIQAPQLQGGLSNAAYIPNYSAVIEESTMDVAANLGIDYVFSSKYNRLYPYLGISLPFYYGARSLYNPTVTVTGTGTNTVITIVDVGTRYVEMFGFGGQIAAGVDYYLLEGFYFGFEIKPASYIYLYSTKYPAPGLEELQADTHTLSFFTQPFLKIGFRF